MKNIKNKAGKILHNLGFGVLVLISIVIMGLVLWINLKNWLRSFF